MGSIKCSEGVRFCFRESGAAHSLSDGKCSNPALCRVNDESLN